jgi:EAL domain-containing protein (putative c-di-GMP-specific phosphodiesterase class I)
VIRCRDCETLPEAPPDSGALHLAPTLAPTVDKLRALLRRSRIEVRERNAGILSVELRDGALAKLALDLAGLLTSSELRDTPCLVTSNGAEPALADFVRVAPLARLVGRIRGEWVRQMLAEERLVTHFQPIVEAGERDRVFAHECLVRGRERSGALVPPGEMLPVVKAAGLLSPFDRAARLSAVRAAERVGLPWNVFVNLNPNAIHDPATCLASTFEAVERSAIEPERVVFEVTDAEEVADSSHLAALVSLCRQRGFRVALDDLGAGYASVRLLVRLKPDFVKLDRELLEGIDSDAFKARFVEKLLDVARSLDIPTVAEGVETEEEWLWVHERRVEYVQGFYVALPDDPPRPLHRPLRTA